MIIYYFPMEFSWKCYANLTGPTPTQELILHRIIPESPFIVCVVTAITISIFNISPILNIQLHYRDYFECNYFLIF